MEVNGKTIPNWKCKNKNCWKLHLDPEQLEMGF